MSKNKHTKVNIKQLNKQRGTGGENLFLEFGSQLRKSSFYATNDFIKKIN